MNSQVSADARPPRSTAADPDRAPLSVQRRFGLLCILLILPVTAVCLPAILVTALFGQHPHSKATAARAPDAVPDVSGLRHALERNAQGVLPPPPGLGPDPIVLTVRADHVAARAGRVTALARQFGATITDGVPEAGERELFIDVPAAGSAPFREALRGTGPLPAAPAPAATASAGAKDHLQVIIRAAADDE